MKRPFERALLHLVRRSSSGEQFELPVLAELSLEEALAVDLRGADQLGCVSRALQLAAAFDDELESPSIAACIRRVLQNDRRAIEIIRRNQSKLRALDERRAFARREGREVITRAPKFGDRSSSTGLRLKDLLNPAHGASIPRVVKSTRG